MITANGNNFGAGAITLDEYLSPEICIFNGGLYFDPSNPTYRAATVLEIYLPDLPINKSAQAFVFFKTSTDNAEYSGDSCVPVLAWIKDKNTLCIEKLTEWDEQAQVGLYIQAAFIPDRIRESITRHESKTVEITSSDYTYQLAEGKYYEAENWIYLYLEFSQFTHATPGQDGMIILGTMPLFKRTELPLINLYAAGYIMGNSSAVCEIYDNEIHCNGLSEIMTKYSTPVLISGFYIKESQ